MARALKWVLIVVAVVVVLLVAAVVAVVTLVDPNAYRDEIAQAVEQRTGRQLVIEGDLDLTFFPWLGLALGRAHLSDAPGFGEQPFVELDGARLAVAVWPLLSERRLVLDKIVVDGLDLRLIRNEQGVGNWEDLAERFAKQEQAQQEQPPPQEGGGMPAIESQGGLELTNATILWQDRQSGASYLVEPLNLTVSELNPEAPIPLRATWALHGQDVPNVGGELAARVVYDQAAQTVRVEDLALDALLKGGQIPGGEQQVALRGTVDGDLQAQTYRIPEATLQLAGIVAKLSGQASLQGELPTATAELAVPSFNARELMRRLGMQPPETADPNALANLSLSAAAQYDGKGVVLRNLQGQVDDTSITGEARVPSFAPLAANFKLSADQINLDRYLAPEAEQAPAGGPAPTEPSEPAETELPMDMLRQLTLDGTVAIGQLTAKKLDVSDFQAKITARDGVIRAEPVATLYQGRLRGQLSLDATGQQPRFAMQQRLEGVQAGSLLEDVIGVARILGVADLDLAADMQGMSVDDWLQSISGRAKFRFSDGAINGINIARAIQVARAKLAGEALPAAAGANQTPFNTLAGSLTIDEGMVVNRDFNLASPLFKIAGDGKFNLRTQEVDYTLNVDLAEAFAQTDNRLLNELRNVPIPVAVTGSFRDLGVNVGLQQALERAGKARLQAEEQKLRGKLQSEIEERRKKAEEKLGGELTDKLQKGLEGLLGPRRKDEPAPQQ